MSQAAPTDASAPDSTLYLEQMAEVRDRLAAVTWLGQSEQVFKGSHDYVLESMFLQLRKILELIAFSSLTANKAKYAAAHTQFERHWKAAKMLKALRDVNPNFYPQPAKLTHVPAKGEAAQYALLKDGFLTTEEFEFLYDVSSEILHTRNPFQQKRAIEIKYDIRVWVERIRALLAIHLVHFVDGRRWLVYAPEHGKHQVFTVVGQELGK